MNTAVRIIKGILMAGTVSNINRLPLPIPPAMALDESPCTTDGTANKKMGVLPLFAVYSVGVYGRRGIGASATQNIAKEIISRFKEKRIGKGSTAKDGRGQVVRGS
jgi:hypothetical protein